MRQLRPAHLIALAAAAGCTEHGAVGVARGEIVGGSRETGEPWVVAILHQDPGSTRIQLCTGSVIGPRAVLTAKHCVYFDDGSGTRVLAGASTFTVRVTDDATDETAASSAHAVTEVVTTPGDDVDADVMNGDDVAILVLADDVPVTPVAISRVAPAVGEPVRIVGFGRDGADVLGLKNTGAAAVSDVGVRRFESTGDAWTCIGDSGGPAVATDRGVLAGITSNGPRGCTVSNSFYVRVDAHVPLIDSVIGGPPPDEDAGPPPDTDAGPAPVVDAGSTPDPGGSGGRRGGGGCAAAPDGVAPASCVALAVILLGRRRRARR